VKNAKESFKYEWHGGKGEDECRNIGSHFDGEESSQKSDNGRCSYVHAAQILD